MKIRRQEQQHSMLAAKNGIAYLLYSALRLDEGMVICFHGMK